MKNIINRFLIFGAFLLAASLSAQVIINADAGTAKTAVSSPSVLLEFGNDNNKGIVMPYVETLPENPVPGTIIYYVGDADGDLLQYHMYYYSTANAWVDLSVQTQDLTAAEMSSVTDVQGTVIEASNARTVIKPAGEPVDTGADGILVLESASKAMVLPIVDNLNNVRSPSLGMIVYYDDPANENGPYLAVYGGTKWTLWLPEAEATDNK